MQDVNFNNVSIEEEEILSGNIGDSYVSKQKEIKGYFLKNTKRGAQGLFTDQNKTVQYIYEKASEIGGDIIIKYQDEEGKNVLNEGTLAGGF